MYMGINGDFHKNSNIRQWKTYQKRADGYQFNIVGLALADDYETSTQVYWTPFVAVIYLYVANDTSICLISVFDKAGFH